jgi:hypothetical protein
MNVPKKCFSVLRRFAALASQQTAFAAPTAMTHSVQPLALRVCPSYILRALGADAVAVAIFDTHAFVERLKAPEGPRRKPKRWPMNLRL